MSFIINSPRWGRPTHSQRLETWLGKENVNHLTSLMGNFYYPVGVHGVPGNVKVMPGGDFCGQVEGGQETSAMERAYDALQKHKRTTTQYRLAQMFPKQRGAFGSLSALIAARTGGKGCDFQFQKTGVASNAIGNANDLWVATGQPAAGAAGSAAAAGRAPTNATTGAMGFVNAVSTANTSHFAAGWLTGSVINNTLLLYDRIFDVAKTMNSTATEAVTGVPTRYQSQTTTNADYVGGNFCYPMNPTTVLPATAHNWTVCQYTDQGGNATQSFPSATGVSAGVVGGVDLAAGAGSWFMPLASGDTGVKALTQMQCSALVATGTITFVVAHPIAFMPCPVANLVCTIDGINTAFNLITVFDNACLSLLEMPKPATTATTYAGQITTVSE